MAYKIPTPRGYWLVDDESRVALEITYTLEELPILSEKVRRHIIASQRALAGLELVCDEDRPGFGDFTVRRLYYAHPGTYRFLKTENQEMTISEAEQ